MDQQLFVEVKKMKKKTSKKKKTLHGYIVYTRITNKIS